MFDYTDLHAHTTYSCLDSCCRIDDMTAKAKELGSKYLACTDHGNISAFCEFEQSCKKNGIQALFGCEFYCSDMDKPMGPDRSHLTVLAKNLVGYRNLLQLVTLAWKNFYYYPILKSHDLLNLQEGLIVFSGCLDGKISKLIIADDYEGAKKLAQKLNECIDDFYLEIQPFSLDNAIKATKGIDRISKETGIELVATNDVHYVDVSDQETRRILRAIRLRKTVAEVDADTQNMSMLTGDEIATEFNQLYGNSVNWKNAIANTIKIADSFEKFDMPKSVSFNFGIENKEQIFFDLCRKGMTARGLAGKTEYENRLKYEYDLIRDKGFIDYFLFMYDMIHYAKTNGIFCGPGRGSSSGSIICFLLEITEVDPIRFGLYFERFIDINRSDYPDIDVDFEDVGRSQVLQYVIDKYGADNVAKLGTYAFFKGKNSIDEIQKVYSLPVKGAATIKKFLIERSDADSRAAFTLQDTFNKFPQVHKVLEISPDFEKAKKLEGLARHRGIHAAGIVVSKEPLYNFAAIYRKDDENVLSLAKEDVGYLGLLKVDMLGLKAMTVLKNICNKIGWTYQDMLKIPLDDSMTLKAFSEADIRGIFQYDGRTAEGILFHLKADTFDLIKDVNALVRPGPLYCLSGTTLIYDCDSDEIISMAKAFKRKIKRTLSLFPDGSIRPQEIKRWFRTGSWRRNRKDTLRVSLKNGRVIYPTAEHLFMTDTGWKKAGDLNIGDGVFCTNKKIWAKGQSKYTDVRLQSIAEKNSINGKGRTPWNKGLKCPDISDLRRQEWQCSPIRQQQKKNSPFIELWKNNRELGMEYVRNGSEKAVQKYNSLTEEEKNKFLEPFIKAGTENGYGIVGIAADGHRTESRFEASFEEFLIANCIKHEEHPKINGGRRKADYKIKGVFIECDGMDRSKEYWSNKYCHGEPYIVIYPKDNFQYKLDFVFEEITNHDWHSMGLSKIVNIQKSGKSVVYDIEMQEMPNYLANGIVVHNSRETTRYIDIRKGIPVEEEHIPELDEITRKTYGRILYQEQVMQVVREIGNFSWEDTTKIRKAMSKSLGDEYMNTMKTKFIEGAASNGYEKDVASKIWERLLHHGSWSFNLSHAVAYTILGFWMMYFKQHYSQVFHAMAIASEHDDEVKDRLIVSYFLKGGKILPPRLNYSNVNWDIEGDAIRAGLTNISGIGNKTAEAVIKKRPFSSIEDMEHKKVSKKVIALTEEYDLLSEKCSVEEFPILKKYRKIQIPERTHTVRQADYYTMETCNSEIVMAGYIVDKMLYNIYEEDHIKGINRTYKNPELQDLMIITFDDLTGVVKLQSDRYLFAEIKDFLYNLDSDTPVKVVCKGRPNSRVLILKSIEEIV